VALALGTLRRLRHGVARRIQATWRSHRMLSALATAAKQEQGARELAARAHMEGRVGAVFPGAAACRVQERYAAVLIQARWRGVAGRDFVRRLRRYRTLLHVRELITALGVAVVAAEQEGGAAGGEEVSSPTMPMQPCAQSAPHSLLSPPPAAQVRAHVLTVQAASQVALLSQVSRPTRSVGTMLPPARASSGTGRTGRDGDEDSALEGTSTVLGHRSDGGARLSSTALVQPTWLLSGGQAEEVCVVLRDAMSASVLSQLLHPPPVSSCAQALRVWTVIGDAMRGLQSSDTSSGGGAAAPPAADAARSASRIRSFAASMWGRGGAASATSAAGTGTATSPGDDASRQARLRQLQAAHELLSTAFGEELMRDGGHGRVVTALTATADTADRATVPAHQVAPEVVGRDDIRILTSADGTVLVESQSPRHRPLAPPAAAPRPLLRALTEHSSGSDSEGSDTAVAVGAEGDGMFGTHMPAPDATEAAATAAAVTQILARTPAAAQAHVQPMLSASGETAAGPPTSAGSRRGFFGSMSAMISGAASSFRVGPSSTAGKGSDGQACGLESLPRLPPLPPLRAVLAAHERACDR